MSVTLSVPDDIATSAIDIARRCGVATEDVLLDVLRLHFPPLPPELLAEFDALELASDEDFAALAEREGL